MPEPVPGTLAEALAALQGRLPRVAKDQPYPCCPHCVHEPGYVHIGPCLMPEEHGRPILAPKEAGSDA